MAPTLFNAKHASTPSCSTNFCWRGVVVKRAANEGGKVARRPENASATLQVATCERRRLDSCFFLRPGFWCYLQSAQLTAAVTCRHTSHGKVLPPLLWIKNLGLQASELCVLMFSLKQSFAYYLVVISEFNLQPWPLTFRIVGPKCRELPSTLLAENVCRAPEMIQPTFSPSKKDGEVPAPFFFHLFSPTPLVAHTQSWHGIFRNKSSRPWNHFVQRNHKLLYE